MRTVIVYLLAFGAIVVALLFGFPELFGQSVRGDAQSRSPRSVAPVVVARVVRAPFIDSLEALGTVRANESVSITSNRADHVKKIHFVDGQQVEARALLVEMNVAEEQAQLAEATAVRDDRKLNFERAKDLFDQKLTSQREFEAAKALLDASKARVLGLQASIADRQIRAPFAGVLGLRQISVGAYLQPSTLITTLDDLSVVKLDFTIPEVWLRTVQPGMRVSTRGSAWPGQEFVGKVATIATRLDARSRSATVRALLPNPGHKLKPGMLLQVKIARGEEPVLQVPEEALIPVGEEHFVFRIGTKDGAKDVAERVSVTVGRRRVGVVEIEGGLAVDDLVVIEGIVRVRPGAKVIVVKIRNPKS